MKREPVCAVILAAGKSSRMGVNKQLLKLDGMYLLERVIKKVLAHSFDQVIVVIGFEASRIQQLIQLDSSCIQWVMNADYEKGQSTSFLTAIRHLQKNIQSAMFFLGDQPFITNETIESTFEKGRERATSDSGPFVIRPFFEGKPGHPVFWGNVRLVDFETLSGDKGGRRLMGSFAMEKFSVDDPYVVFDIDTPDDFEEAKRLS